MRVLFAIAFLWASSPSDLVDLARFDFSIKQDIRYATKNNFMKQAVYPEPRCILRRSVLEALSRVQTNLKMDGLGLKVFDCYRPLSIQRKLWEVVADERYVSDPKKGSKHNRGAAVDVTLVDKNGNELEMPTPYNDFTKKAHRSYQGGSQKSRFHRKRLETAMQREGFMGVETEWWHFDHKDWEKFPVEDLSFQAIP